MSDAWGRTPQGVFDRMRQRLDALEARLAKTFSLPSRLAADLSSLGAGIDLNTITATGWYLQGSNANATLALNYPVASRAGHLEVSGSTYANDFVLQVYTDYLNGKQYRRSYYNGTWTDWVQIIGVAADLPVATTALQGIVELATTAETQTGTDATRAVTPAGLAAALPGAATTSASGVVELATNAETQTGTDAVRAVTPAGLASVTATTSRSGLVELATDAEAQAGSDTTRAVTPANLGSGWATLTLASGWATESGFMNVQYRLQGGVLEISGSILIRTSALAVAAGTLYTIGTLPSGFRPSAGVGDAGAIGVAGTLGACQWRINTSGTIQFSPYVASGTIAIGGGVQNSVILPTIKTPL